MFLISRFFSILCFLSLFSFSASAFLEMTWSQKLDLEKRTHIIVLDQVDILGPQFQLVALAQAQKLRELEPDSQVIILSNLLGPLDTEIIRLQNWTDANIKNRNSKIKTLAVLDRISDFKKIATLIVLSHTAPHLNSRDKEKSSNFNFTNPKLTNLRGHFTEDAIALLQGCNTGFISALGFSNIWKIPVLGSLTSLSFQKLNEDGQFYSVESGLTSREFEQKNWKSENDQSFLAPWKCPAGDCLRLKPDNHPYSGKWGQFSAGLGFYKWFCPNLSEDICLKGMFRGAQLWLGKISLNSQIRNQDIQDEKQISEFENQNIQNEVFLSDFFCPQNSKSQNEFSECEDQIQHALKDDSKSYSSFHGTSLQCQFTGCDFIMKCSDQCELITNLVSSTTTMMDEIRHYLKAFRLYSY